VFHIFNRTKDSSNSPYGRTIKKIKKIKKLLQNKKNMLISYDIDLHTIRNLYTDIKFLELINHLPNMYSTPEYGTMYTVITPIHKWVKNNDDVLPNNYNDMIIKYLNEIEKWLADPDKHVRARKSENIDYLRILTFADIYIIKLVENIDFILPD
jgi:hypothetical protein